MFSNLLADFVDSNFLTRETAELSRVNAQLKGALALNRATLSEQAQQLAAGESQLAGLGTQRQSLIAEIQQVADRQSQAQRETTTAQNKAALASAALTKVEAQLAQVKAQLSELKATGVATAIAQVKAAAAETEATALEAIAEFEASIAAAADTAARLDTEAADKATALQQVNAELNRVNAALSQAETRFSEKHTALLQAYEAALVEHREKLQTLAGQTAERVSAFELEIKNRENRIAELEGRFEELRAEIIEAAERENDIARRQFENAQTAAMQSIEQAKIDANHEIAFNREALLEKYRPLIEAPLLAEIEALQVEVGRTHKKLAEKAGDSLVWNPDQIREFLLDIDADGDSPSHARICGATKSGKSFFVNQIISGGLKSLGFDAQFTVVDPYHSQTKWAVAPTVSNDPAAAVALIMGWAEACDGTPLAGPSVLVVDELDSLITDYGEKLAAAIKTIVKKGRHYNRFFYWLGQNGNSPKGMQWSDVKNFNQIYLGSVGDDYCENGLKGRQKNRWLGELESLRDRSKYHGIVHCKGCNPYTRLLPKSYFETEATAAASETEATAAPTKMVCPKCQSTKTKKSGKLDGRQRLYCHGCKSQSFAE